MDQKPNLPHLPTKVRIIKCGRSSWWYAKLVGQEFNVRLGGSFDHILWEDYWNKVEVMRHIAQEDCEIINTTNINP
jgi:hypothetical protein